MSVTAASSPVVVIPANELADHLGRQDVFIITYDVDVRSNECTVSIPQFGVHASAPLPKDLDAESGNALSGRLLKSVVQDAVAFYAALTELPEDFITDVEVAQINVFQKVFFPWFASTVGSDPEAWAAPANVLHPKFA